MEQINYRYRCPNGCGTKLVQKPIHTMEHVDKLNTCTICGAKLILTEKIVGESSMTKTQGNDGPTFLFGLLTGIVIAGVILGLFLF